LSFQSGEDGRPRRALEKAGFRLEAVLKSSVIKNNIIEDSCIYAILKDEFEDR
jgi:ribosomal-protein-alanine N-acetyltransferase